MNRAGKRLELIMQRHEGPGVTGMRNCKLYSSGRGHVEMERERKKDKNTRKMEKEKMRNSFPCVLSTYHVFPDV